MQVHLLPQEHPSGQKDKGMRQANGSHKLTTLRVKHQVWNWWQEQPADQ
jgi:hypothetical protein